MIIIEVPDIPKAKDRPRKGRHGNFYTPKATVEAERSLGWEAKRAMNGSKPLDWAVSVDITAYFVPPLKWNEKKKKRALWGEICPTTKPDLDNICKTVLDGMNKIVYLDDKQVVTCRISKRYREHPGLRIEIMPMAKLS